MKVVGVCGLGFTGSGAVTDLLREYEEVEYNQHFHEFSLCYYTDGLLDLKHHLLDQPIRFESSDAALYRFNKLIHTIYSSHHLHVNQYNRELLELSEEYIADITQIKWSGTWGFRLCEETGIRKFLIKVLFKLRPIIGDYPYIKLTNTIMRFSICPDNFLERTKQYIEDTLSIVSGRTDKYILLDQAFPGDHSQDCFEFFQDAKAIVVDRDPRDVYLLSKYDVHADSSWIPTDTVEHFIFYYDRMRNKANFIGENVLKIQFEDLIYEYDSTVKCIELFLGIENHVNKDKYLDIKRSILNTQLYNKYSNEGSNINKIEEKLEKYLYDFSKYPIIKSNVKTW